MNANEKLSYEAAQEIRRLYGTGAYSRYALSRLYCVSVPTIKCIVCNQTYNIASIWDRLLEQTIIDGTCFLWTGDTDDGGYGRISYNGSRWRIHRLVYCLVSDMDIESWHILHSCDTRRCWNPSHLFYGTNLDNIHDKTVKQRNEHSENHHAAKLSNQDVIEIRSRYRAGWQDYLAQEYGVSQSVISRIIARKSWRCV